MIIYLVRHGESLPRTMLSDEEGCRIGLSDLGKIQARTTAKKLKSLGIEKIFSSPIVRASDTAKIISEVTMAPLKYLDELSEFSVDLESVDSQYLASLKKKSYENPDLVAPAGGSLSQSVSRLLKVVDDLGSSSANSVCLVSHRIIIEGLLSRLFDIKNEEHEWLLPASISAIKIDPKKEKKLLFYNRRPLDFDLFTSLLRRKMFFVRAKVFGSSV